MATTAPGLGRAAGTAFWAAPLDDGPPPPPADGGPGPRPHGGAELLRPPPARAAAAAGGSGAAARIRPGGLRAREHGGIDVEVELDDVLRVELEALVDDE